MKVKKKTDQHVILKSTVFIVVCLLFSFNAYGHSLYIQSSRYKVHEGKRSPLFFCYGHHIPVDDGVKGKKLKYIKIQSPGAAVQELEIRNETCLHSYMVNYSTPGTYVLSAETTPGYYTVYIDKKGRERHTIKPKSAVIKNAQKIIKSLYSKQYTKTYVVCDTPSSNFPSHVGLNLELVPVKDISTLKSGETLELIVYYKGKPYKGEGTWDATFNGFSTESEDNFYPKTRVSGSDRIKIPIPNAGRWFVRYFIKIDAKGEELEKFSQMKYTASLVFQIPNKKKEANL
ncbi:DUF4198 domain-containing protein [Desulfobacula toluolica]|uniref:Conserved uncharacterized protein n=1 Tax=Desulfobacula toluolica (strain DSM 7467 / Tol2) TaxID=651182 RepID=K0NN69_DESTT|nr:DUF4198 domain-containing protein [Desulfobacula toluolica]CCK81458.1 conserved uncharacterized protein [Desulfobacula toluolica Tol2]